MLLAGDEFGGTQHGNNNAFCHANSIRWLDWDLRKKNSDLFRFFPMRIRLKKNHSVFRRTDFFPDHGHELFHEIRWPSYRPEQQDWSPSSQVLAFVLNGNGREAEEQENDFFVMLNGHQTETGVFEAPQVKQKSALEKNSRHRRTFTHGPPGRICCRITAKLQGYQSGTHGWGGAHFGSVTCQNSVSLSAIR